MGSNGTQREARLWLQGEAVSILWDAVEVQTQLKPWQPHVQRWWHVQSRVTPGPLGWVVGRVKLQGAEVWSKSTWVWGGGHLRLQIGSGATLWGPVEPFGRWLFWNMEPCSPGGDSVVLYPPTSLVGVCLEQPPSHANPFLPTAANTWPSVLHGDS